MATWHQQKARIGSSWRPMQWTIVTDPPNEMRTHMSFPDEASARAALEQWRARGDRHSYLVAPVKGES